MPWRRTTGEVTGDETVTVSAVEPNEPVVEIMGEKIGAETEAGAGGAAVGAEVGAGTGAGAGVGVGTWARAGTVGAGEGGDETVGLLRGAGIGSNFTDARVARGLRVMEAETAGGIVGRGADASWGRVS